MIPMSNFRGNWKSRAFAVYKSFLYGQKRIIITTVTQSTMLRYSRWVWVHCSQPLGAPKFLTGHVKRGLLVHPTQSKLQASLLQLTGLPAQAYVLCREYRDWIHDLFGMERRTFYWSSYWWLGRTVVVQSTSRMHCAYKHDNDKAMGQIKRSTLVSTFWYICTCHTVWGWRNNIGVVRCYYTRKISFYRFPNSRSNICISIIPMI